MNAATTDDYVELIEIGGREYLLYQSFPIDVALIRGTTADERGNLAMDAASARYLTWAMTIPPLFLAAWARGSCSKSSASSVESRAPVAAGRRRA
ncbi:MAG: hypothetical protein WBF34_03575 [Streptosporangiaceae bacterium]|jgi:hypothetical protein